MLLPPRTDSPWFHDFSWRRREWILHPWSPALRRPQELSAVPVDDRSVSPAELEFVSVIAHGDCSMLDTSEMLDEDMTAEELRPERLASSV
jgi:hypothetical protein